MKIGVISDTHIPFYTKTIPNTILDHFKGTDMILHAGDLVNISALHQLLKITKRVEAVAGNMDLPDVQAVLPKKKIITAGKYKIGLIHGWGPPKSLLERVRAEFNKVDIIVFGHSHQPFNEEHNGILFFNPGSATDQVSTRNSSIGILELNDTKKGKIIRL